MDELEHRRFDFLRIFCPLQLLRTRRDLITFEKRDFRFFVVVDDEAVEVDEFILRSERTEVENCFNKPAGNSAFRAPARF